MLSRASWGGRRVLLTGHTGFKGAWTSLVLRSLGAQVRGVALAPDTEPNLYTLANLGNAVDSRELDIRDRNALRRVVSEYAPEIVIHMAAQSLVRRSYASPVETYETNVMGTINVLEAVRGVSSVRCVVVVTTDKCYVNREWPGAYHEDEPLGGRDPYSSSKACAEIVTASWRDSFFAEGSPAIASARAGNVIGGGDWAADRIIPDCVRAFTKRHPVELRHPGAVRPWQHVLEPVLGYLLLAERLAQQPSRFAEAWNFGPYETDSDSVEKVVGIFSRHWGEGARWTSSPGPNPHEAMTLRIDSSKARMKLGWRPRLALEEAIAWTAEWYRGWASGVNATALCEKQIDKYLALTSTHA